MHIYIYCDSELATKVLELLPNADLLDSLSVELKIQSRQLLRFHGLVCRCSWYLRADNKMGWGGDINPSWWLKKTK